jgi:hypothetical protein
VASQDDGEHFEEGGLWPISTIPRIHLSVRTRQLPRQLEILNGPMTNGVVYIRVLVNESTRAALSVGFEGAEGYRWHVEALRDLPGTADIWTPGIDGTEGSFLVSLDGSSRVILKVLNLAFDGYDPDFLIEERLPFSLDLDLVLEEVAIDIKPDSTVNPINLMSRGLTPVAILGSDTFDVRDVDVETLTFGSAGTIGTEPAHHAGSHFTDVNDDGFTDLLSHYRTRNAGFTAEDTEACVTGETLDGTPFEGCDSILIVGGVCGLGFELALLVPGLMWLRQRRCLN